MKLRWLYKITEKREPVYHTEVSVMEGKWDLMDLCSPNIPQNTHVYTHMFSHKTYEDSKVLVS